MCKHFVFSFLLKFVLKFLRLGFKIFWFLTTKLLWLDNVMEIFNRFFLCCDDLHFHIKETGKQNWQISRQLCLTRFTHLYLLTLKFKGAFPEFIHSTQWTLVCMIFVWMVFVLRNKDHSNKVISPLTVQTCSPNGMVINQTDKRRF